MIIIVRIIFCLVINSIVFAEEKISPFKVDNFENPASYEIPKSSIFTVSRLQKTDPEIIYYLTKPDTKVNQQIPITIFVTGSSLKNSLYSVIHVHRYFLAEVLSLNSAMLTLEQYGIINDKIDEQQFFEHYTLTQRYQDHKQVIEALQANPPSWWNSKIILIGVSEGCPIVTNLTTTFNDLVIATVGWVGVSDINWRDELWEYAKLNNEPESWYNRIQSFITDWWAYGNKYTDRQKYDLLMDDILLEPVANKEFFGMTYKYHADAMNFPAPNYKKLTEPFLVVTGALDYNTQITDNFVKKAKEDKVNITYIKVPDMDHYIRKRPDIIDQSFAWIRDQLWSSPVSPNTKG